VPRGFRRFGSATTRRFARGWTIAGRGVGGITDGVGAGDSIGRGERGAASGGLRPGGAGGRTDGNAGAGTGSGSRVGRELGETLGRGGDTVAVGVEAGVGAGAGSSGAGSSGAGSSGADGRERGQMGGPRTLMPTRRPTTTSRSIQMEMPSPATRFRDGTTAGAARTGTFTAGTDGTSDGADPPRTGNPTGGTATTGGTDRPGTRTPLGGAAREAAAAGRAGRAVARVAARRAAVRVRAMVSRSWGSAATPAARP
jgi:hypothetical protein